MATVRTVDCAILPPCAKTLRQKVKRAHFISIIWGNADSESPANGLSPLDYGWKDDEGRLVPDWYEGSAMPDELFEPDIAANGRPEGIADDDLDDGTESEYSIGSGSDYAWSGDEDSDAES